MSVSHPALNAALNLTSAILLTCGWLMIRRGRIQTHRRFMIAAFVTSTFFLISYIVYHYTAGATRFTGTGAIRTFYFSILISHTVLALFVPPLAIIAIWNGLKMRVETHRRFARWALPLWMYVSVTGVMVYVMLYHL